MAPPTSYTESSLAEFMFRSINNFAEIFGWTDTTLPPYPDCVNEVMRAGGLSSLSSVPAEGLGLLEAGARLAIWQAVMRRLATEYDYTSDGQSFYRSQMYKSASAELALAEKDLEEAQEEVGVGGGSGGTIVVGRFLRLDESYPPNRPVP